MLDPIKSTIVTPGLSLDGKFDKTGIPASIVTKYLAEHGVVVEKTGLYSFFVMFTIGITKGRWNTLLTALQQFKDDYEKNQPMGASFPSSASSTSATSAWALRDLCQHVHEMYAKYDIARLTTEMYLSVVDLTPAMKPSDAYALPSARPSVWKSTIWKAASPWAGHALSTRHSAAHSWRSVQQEDRGLPQVRPQNSPNCAPVLKPTSTAWWRWKTRTGRCASMPTVWPPKASHPGQRRLPRVTADNIVQLGDDGPYGRTI